MNKSRWNRAAVRRRLFILAFLAPTLGLVGLFLAYPILDCFRLSVSSWPRYGSPTFLSAEGRPWHAHFERIFGHEYFWLSLKNNLIFTAVSTIGTVGIGFLLALALHRRVRGWRFFRLVWYLPVTFAFIVVGMLWGRLYDTSGLLNRVVSAVPPVHALAEWAGWRPSFNWLQAPWGMYFIALVAVWQYSGFTMMVILSGLDDIPKELYEAATVDGATGWRSVWHITLPLAREVLLAITVIQIIFSFRVFDLVYAISKDRDLQVIASYMYARARETHAGAAGEAAAVGVVMLLVGFALATGYVLLVRRRQTREGR